MKKFLQLAHRFRQTPIVDDDFPVIRDLFDRELAMRLATMPKIVCLCGSTRFIQEFDDASLRETLAGNIVLSVGSHQDRSRQYADWSESHDPMQQSVKLKLDELHKRKIDLCDEVFVLNVDGYIGKSTLTEIEYAERRGIPVRYLHPYR